jgi:hypothetical protein
VPTVPDRGICVVFADIGSSSDLPYRLGDWRSHT